MNNKREFRELKDLTLLDRFLFAETVEDPEAMALILEIILGKEIMIKYLPQTEREQRPFTWSRHIRLDVWTMDTEDNVYDTEVQKENKYDLPKRSRLYNSIIDSKLLQPGIKSFNKLNDVFVIIIAPFDIFGKDLYKYTFNMRCNECPEIKLKDGATRIFLNTRGTDPTGVSDELIQLLRYFEVSDKFNAAECTSEKILKLHRKVGQIKASEEIGVKYMNLWEEQLEFRQEGYEEGLREGELKGKQEGKLEGLHTTAVKMKENNFDCEVISEITGLSLEEIAAI